MAEAKYVADYLHDAAQELGDKTFLVCADRALSWSEADVESRSIASFIAEKLNGRQQAVIGILLPDTWQFVLAYFGAVTSGSIAMPIDITFKKLEVEFITKSINPEFVIVNQQTKDLIDGPSVLIEDILGQKIRQLIPEPTLPPEKQLATLFFSSGTTGRPKPIPNTHQNQIWDAAALTRPMEWTSDDRLLINLHLAHRHGLVVCLFGAVYHQNTVYLQERFNVENTLAMLGSGKISIYSNVPSAYAQLIKHEAAKKYDLSKVRLFASSSSALPPALRQAFKNSFGHEILDRYGTSETGSLAIMSSTGNAFERLLDGVHARLEKNGEVAVRSPGVFPGYYNNPQATREKTTHDGWWLTGDIGELQDNKIALKGRLDEQISRAGYSVFPRDIEWALLQNPDIKEVKVVGLADADEQIDPQDKIIAFFNGSAEIESLQEYSSSSLPRSWRPDKFIKLANIPKTANGKPKLSELKKLAKQAQ